MVGTATGTAPPRSQHTSRRPLLCLTGSLLGPPVPPVPWYRRYLDGKKQMLYAEPRDVFPCDIIQSEECEVPLS